ncbi:hypothetical protein GPECTOR_38g273 [Gonium pectorale]|uniref:F-box domain-containing protein n=1 Tax=Gonium pectorale TaxID=33097 RepID=A0A150GB11_GONPE|nr:hypothetical protein GPECTOR_38g273 [Gonium pectorale]|eukprot:KXZ47036.1 hypothetical protein GPECTOR_38g273 [Gonium pectorale]
MGDIADTWMWHKLPVDVLERIASGLHANEVAVAFRLISKSSSLLRSPQHSTIHLSQPVPPRVFAAHWLAPGATRKLTLKQRRQLMSLTAASGVLPNLEVAVQAAGCLPTCEAFEAAAAGGHLASCQWLWDQLADWLMRGPDCPLQHAKPLLLRVVAEGCDLAALQRRVQQWGWGWPAAQQNIRLSTLAAAAGSPTPDWAVKIKWLEAQSSQTSPNAAENAAARPDAAARLAWLRDRGYPLGWSALGAAVRAGNLAALQPLLEQLAPAQPEVTGTPIYRTQVLGSTHVAAEAGHLPVLRAPHAADY